MMSGLSRVRERGQAAVEAVALVPVLLLVVVAAWPDMQADLRPCLARSRSPEYQSYFRHRPLAATIDLRARVAVPVLLPAAGDVSVVARGAVRSR